MVRQASFFKSFRFVTSHLFSKAWAWRNRGPSPGNAPRQRSSCSLLAAGPWRTPKCCKHTLCTAVAPVPDTPTTRLDRPAGTCTTHRASRWRCAGGPSCGSPTPSSRPTRWSRCSAGVPLACAEESCHSGLEAALKAASLLQPDSLLSCIGTQAGMQAATPDYTACPAAPARSFSAGQRAD